MAVRMLVEKAAKNCWLLRQRGIPARKTVGVLLAKFVMERRHSLLHDHEELDFPDTALGLPVLRAGGDARP